MSELDPCWMCGAPWAQMCQEKDERIAELEAKVLVMKEEIAAAWSVADIETNKVEQLEKENEILREALGDAIDSYEEYAQYAGDYLMKKHRVDEDIAELRKVLESSDEED